MDRQRVAVNPPIALESHPLPSGPTPDLVRRRGLGYQPVPTDPSAEGAPSAAPRPNRAARRKATRPGRLRLAALLVAPASALLGASPSFASPGSSDPSPSSTTVGTSADGSSTGVDGSSSTTEADPNGSSSSSSSSIDDPTSTTGAGTTTTATGRHGPSGGTSTTTTTAATTTSRATTTTTARAGSAGTSGTGSTSSTTLVDDSTTTTSTTIAAATEPLPVGEAELPPETPADADPVAVGASQALALHAEQVNAAHDLADLVDDHAFADVRVIELEGRVSELTGLAFDYAQQQLPTAEVELARAAAQDDLVSLRTGQSTLALQEAATRTVVDDLTARHAETRKALVALVTQRAGGDPTTLDAVWATTSDARLDVVYAALAQVGDPYVWATGGPDTFDCSGLTGFAWKAAGVNLDHYTVTQRQTTLDVAERNLRPGDLVFNLDGGPTGGHVMLFLGIGHVIVHAPAAGQLVSVSEWRTVTGFGSPIADDTLAAVVVADDAVVSISAPTTVAG